jgi:hypothetical protein
VFAAPMAPMRRWVRAATAKPAGWVRSRPRLPVVPAWTPLPKEELTFQASRRLMIWGGVVRVTPAVLVLMFGVPETA